MKIAALLKTFVDSGIAQAMADDALAQTAARFAAMLAMPRLGGFVHEVPSRAADGTPTPTAYLHECYDRWVAIELAFYALHTSPSAPGLALLPPARDLEASTIEG